MAGRKGKNFFESNNPMFNEEKYSRTVVLDSELVGHGEVMTVENAVNKTFVLFAILLVTAVFGYMFASPFVLFGGAIGGFVVYLFTSFKPSRAVTMAPIYAICEGLFVGALSAMYSMVMDNIIFHAATLTLAILLTMLMLYKTGIIKVTERFRNIVMTAVGAIMLVYIVELVLYFCGIDVPFLHDQSPIGIGISLIIVGIASMKLLVDFDNFEKGEEHKLPEHMGWYFGMGLLFTVVWLYSEIMYLLSAFSGD